MASKDDAEVGYGRPPKQNRWVKGRSGNPTGRPKGSKNMSTLLRKIGQELITVSENGKTKIMTRKEACARQFTNKGLSGNTKDALALMRMFMLVDEENEQIDSPVDAIKENQFLIELFGKKLQKIKDANPETKED